MKSQLLPGVSWGRGDFSLRANPQLFLKARVIFSQVIGYNIGLDKTGNCNHV